MSTLLVMAWVPGAPKTKGSMAPVNRSTGAMRESVKGSSQWRQLMARAAEDARCLPEPWTGPCTVTAYFYLPVAEPTATRSGDLDKLTRNLLDALEDAKVWANDVQCVDMCVRKLAAEREPQGRGPGIWFNVVGLSP